MRTFIFSALALFLPFVAFAQDTKIQDILCTVGAIVGQLTPIIAGLALVAFFWGLVIYLFSLGGANTSAAQSMGGGMGGHAMSAATPQGKQAGRSLMLYGIIVLFVMVSIWGLVRILQETFDVSGAGIIAPPRITQDAGTPPTVYSCGTRR